MTRGSISDAPIACFALECYRPGLDQAGAARALQDLAGGVSPSADVEALAEPVGCLVFSDDQVAFFLVKASDAEAARSLAERASVSIDRITSCFVVDR